MNETVPSPHLSPPAHLFSDYVEMTYLGFVILVGTPSNVFILRRLLREYRTTQKDSVKAGFLLLKINLNISDLLILLILALGKLGWLATYEWRGGDALCKVFNFLSMLALYISSNIVVCIALDRLRNVLGASRVRRGKKNYQFIHLLIGFSWLSAILWSIPQLYVWETLNVYPDIPGGWTQCSDIWSIHKFKMSSQDEGTTEEDEVILNDLSQNIYNLSHLFLVFWGPLLILVFCYVIIAIRLMQYSLQQGPGQHLTQFSTRIEGQSTHSFLSQNAGDAVSIDQNGSNLNIASSRRCSSNSTRGKTEDVSLMPGKQITVYSKNEVRVPAWRRQLRSKVFRTTLVVVLAHFLFWFPYNFQAIMKYVNEAVYQELSDRANIFKDLQILITLINPFIYGFTK